MDLDQSPERRWLPIIQAFEPQLAEIKDESLSFFDGKIRPYLREHNVASMDVFYDMAYAALPAEMRAEMKGIFTTFPRVERNLLLVMNLFYELHTACTSSVARKSQTFADNLIHGRNLDLFYPVVDDLMRSMGQNVIRTMVININFRRSEEIVYRGTNFVGQIYPLEGMKYGKFSYSQNSRENTPEEAIGNVIEWAKGRRIGPGERTESCSLVLRPSRCKKILSLD